MTVAARSPGAKLVEPLERRILLAVISNGFESPALALGTTTPVTSAGWTVLGGFGGSAGQIWRPASSTTDFAQVNPLASPADGKQVATIAEPGGAFERFMGTVAAATRYQLTVAVGDALSEAYGDWRVQLLSGASAGSTVLAEANRDQGAAVHPANGGWADNSITFDSNTLPAAVGKNLFVRLVNYSGTHPGAVYFDNVRLNTSVASDLALNATASLVEISNRSQMVRFAKDGSGRFQLSTFVKSGASWASMFDAQMPVIQGTDFNVVPTAYTIVENSASRVAVNFTGTHPTRGYNWSMLVETKTGTDLVHFSVSIPLTQQLTLSGLEPQAAFWINSTNTPVTIGQGPGNIYYGTPEAQWGNSFPAAYVWSSGREAAVFYDMSPMTWMGSGNLNRFWNVRANAFANSGKTGLGLQVVSRSGSTIAAGTNVRFDFHLYEKLRTTQPTKVAALDTMVRAFEPVHPSTASWPTNSLDPANTNWKTFADGLSSNLMLKGIVYDDWNLVPTVGSMSFEEQALANDGISPLTNYGWRTVAGYGSAIPHAWHPGSTVNDFTSVNPLASPAAGSYVGFIQDPGGAAETALGSIQANTTYRVNVAIGNRFAEGEGDWSIQLWAGGGGGGTTMITQVTRDTVGVTHPAAGGWANNLVSFNSTSYSSLVGQNLWVRIANYSGSHPGTIFFDNVRLTAGTLGPAVGSPWMDGPLFTENQVSTVRVSSAYAVGAGSGAPTEVLSGWDFSTSNNYLAPWIAYDRLNPDANRHAFIGVKASDLPLYYDPTARLIRWGTRYPFHLGDFEMSWQNFTFALETIKSYRMLAGGDFNPAIAGKFLMGLPGLVQFAHNVNYNFPQWFNPYSKTAITQQDVPELGTIYEPWQAGTFAWLMLEGYKLTGKTTYLSEAKAAVDRVLETLSYTISNARYNVTYSDPTQFPITEIFGNAWGIAACQQIAAITGETKYQTYSDYFFDSLMRMSYWYESALAGDPADVALQNAGMFRNQGGAFTGSPWENIEAVLPMTLRLKYDAAPRELMLKVLNLHRINDFFNYPAAYPAGTGTPAGVMNSAANYVGIEDFHTYEQGNVNGSMGRATYMSSSAMWNYLLFEAFGGSSDRDVMVLNVDAMDGFNQAAESAARNFIGYNPTAGSKTFLLKMKSLAAGQYNLILTDSAGKLTQSSVSAAALTSGISMTLKAGDWIKIRVENAQFAAMDAGIQAGQGARDRISYAYELLQESARDNGITTALLALKSTYQSALGDYGTGDYASATSRAQQVITALTAPAKAATPTPVRLPARPVFNMGRKIKDDVTTFIGDEIAPL